MNEPEVIKSDNLSEAWLQAFALVAERGNVGPLMVSIQFPEDAGIVECRETRRILDQMLRKESVLKKKRFPLVRETSATIFPYDLWVGRKRPGCKEFSDFYLDRYMPRHRAVCKNAKQRTTSTYFERMINYKKNLKEKNDDSESRKKNRINQIDRIIESWKNKEKLKNKRRPIRSALQIAIFDPREEDPARCYHEFPCLQQISITYNTNKDSIALNAFYPTQYMFKRAYGNYLGLCHLGEFIANALSLRLSGVNVYVGLAERDDLNKGEALSLLKDFNKEIANKETT